MPVHFSTGRAPLLTSSAQEGQGYPDESPTDSGPEGSLGDDDAAIEGDEAPERTECRDAKAKIVASAIVVLFLLGLLCHKQVLRFMSLLLDWIGQLGYFAPVVYAAVVAILNVFMLPVFPMMVGAGLVFPQMFPGVLGQVIGILSVFGGLWIGSLVAFQLGRTWFKEWAQKHMQEFIWMETIDHMIEEEGWWIVFLFRMSPFVPAEVFNYAASMTSISFWHYAIGCIGSIFPVAIWVCTAASAGTAAGLPGSPQEDQSDHKAEARNRNILMLINVVFVIVLSAVLYLAIKKYEKKVKPLVNNSLDWRPDPEMEAAYQEKLRRSVSAISFRPLSREATRRRFGSKTRLGDRGNVFYRRASEADISRPPPTEFNSLRATSADVLL